MGFSTTNYDGSLDRDLAARDAEEAEQEEIEEELMIALGKEEPSRAHAALMEALREKADEWFDRTAEGKACVDPQCPTCCNAALRCGEEVFALLTASTKRLGSYWAAYSEWLGGGEDMETSRLEWAKEQAAIEAAKPRGDGE